MTSEINAFWTISRMIFVLYPELQNWHLAETKRVWLGLAHRDIRVYCLRFCMPILAVMHHLVLLGFFFCKGIIDPGQCLVTGTPLFANDEGT